MNESLENFIGKKIGYIDSDYSVGIWVEGGLILNIATKKSSLGMNRLDGGDFIGKKIVHIDSSKTEIAVKVEDGLILRIFPRSRGSQVVWATEQLDERALNSFQKEMKEENIF
jgi:hypothetical protein